MFCPKWFRPKTLLLRHSTYIDCYDREKFTLIGEDCATMPDKEVVFPLVIGIALSCFGPTGH